MALEISVIIPTFNEAPNIVQTITALRHRAAKITALEIIVVDGGSTDGTQGLLQQFDGVRCLAAPKKGRAAQMNFGAQNALGNVLYFLHADTITPHDFDLCIMNYIAPGKQAGCFRMKFDTGHWWLQLAGWGTRFRKKICRGGDQSLFVTKALFRDINGYDEAFIICEDLEIIDRLWTATHFGVLPESVITSARKYQQKGIWTLQYHFWVIQYLYRRGASPERLYGYYQSKIKS